MAKENDGLLRFFRKVIALRNRHPVFRRSHFLTGIDTNLDQHPDVSWHGIEVDKPDWSENSKTLAFMLDGSELPHEKRDDDFCVFLNGDQVAHSFEVPSPKTGKAWFRIIDTGRASPEDALDEDQGVAVLSGRSYPVLPMAAVVLISSSR
jgi:glycogen operon protein